MSEMMSWRDDLTSFIPNGVGIGVVAASLESSTVLAVPYGGGCDRNWKFHAVDFWRGFAEMSVEFGKCVKDVVYANVGSVVALLLCLNFEAKRSHIARCRVCGLEALDTGFFLQLFKCPFVMKRFEVFPLESHLAPSTLSRDTCTLQRYPGALGLINTISGHLASSSYPKALGLFNAIPEHLASSINPKTL
ncbi:hypothetical protein POM88_038638 [Heracleum sosnowskyi]|uniref:Uncharacterized protein n=1 Tax=Heracleum sosnowskyi TaxID=360622 RepID=A0AAD8M825_9APIA|nr:hypothetical protein POM88_038638 [Heracleum sosnowskyi]